MDHSIGRWRVRLRGDGSELAAAYQLRADRFRGGADDRDTHDGSAQHLTIEDRTGLQGYARLWPQTGPEIPLGYSAQFYDLQPVAGAHPRAVEIGRVCLAGDDPEVARLLLGTLTGVVDRTGATLLYGCASFTAEQINALGRLSPHVASCGPGRSAPDIVDIPESGDGPLPTMLRLYLGFGATVSDHAVRDPDLGTVHVLAMLDLGAVSPARARALRALVPGGAEG